MTWPGTVFDFVPTDPSARGVHPDIVGARSGRRDFAQTDDLLLLHKKVLE